jgi:DNA-directed RNA polymerase subunit beta'
LILEQGVKEQIRQLTGMRGFGLKKSTAGGGEIIENPFFLTLKVFLSLSTLFLGARKGLADTA